MSLKSNITEELQRSPLAAISGAVGVVVAALSLVLAWVQYRVAPPSALSPAELNSPPADILLGNVFLVVAYFLAVTVATALLIRAVARKHDIAALFASIPLVALTNFTVILAIYLAPPRPLSPQLFASAHDLVLYASVAIYIAFCGRSILLDLATTGKKKNAEPGSEAQDGGPDGLAVLLIVLLLLAMWSWLVFAGQTRLTSTLLPEVTHLIEVKSSKSGT